MFMLIAMLPRADLALNRKPMPKFRSFYKAPVNTLYGISFDGFQARIGRSKLSGVTFFEQYEDVHRIFVTLEGQTRSTVSEIDAQPAVRRPDKPGAVTIVPAGVRRRVLLEDPDFLVLNMTVSGPLLQDCTDDEPGAADAGDRQPPIVQNVRNHWLLRAAHAFKEAGVSGAPAMQMQGLAFAMVRHLARSPGRIGESGGLDPLALARVLELMNDRLAEDLTLAELAGEAGLGVSAFGRAFAKSLGAPPYRYFAGLRMQRAMELLAHSDQPLANIAGEAGYGDQAHFTAAFTRNTGFSPGKWRSEFGTVPRFLPISRKTALQPSA
jgi:AraC family transcriptional regulator